MRAVRRATTVVALLAALLGAAQPAGATAGDLGYDISHPQCGQALPATGKLWVVGVTRGLPFSVNECLATQVTWAKSRGEVMLYTNTANPSPSSPNWPTSGTGRCGATATSPGCAYEYGRKAAVDALTKATTALTGVLNPKTVTWWLDVEGFRQNGLDGNSWEDDQYANAADLQGFVDGLRQNGVPEVGIYSTALQWTDITGGYTRSKNSAYRSVWGFAGLYPIEDGPLWFAGLGTLDEAKQKCATTSFTGGQRLLAQYKVSDTFDGDYRCADSDKVLPTAAVTAPTSLVTQAYSFGAAWSGADTGGSGLATFDVRTTRVASNGTAFSAWSYPYLRSTARSASLSATGQGWTTCVSVRSRDVAGNVSAWVPSRCTAVPLDDRALSGRGWSRVTASGWFLSTYSSTTQKYASLTRSGLVTSRLHLVAQKCSTCGKVGVYLGGTLLTTVDLHATSSYRAVIALPRFSLRTTSVTVKVLTSGKPVRIDGLVSSRA